MDMTERERERERERDSRIKPMLCNGSQRNTLQWWCAILLLDDYVVVLRFALDASRLGTR